MYLQLNQAYIRVIYTSWPIRNNNIYYILIQIDAIADKSMHIYFLHLYTIYA